MPPARHYKEMSEDFRNMSLNRFVWIVVAAGFIADVQADATSAGAVQPQFGKQVTRAMEDAPVYNIPAVIDRPLKVDDGERVVVTHFDIRGAADHPEDGLYIKDFLALMDGYKSKHASGMTVGELQEAANLVRDAYRKAGYPVAQAFIPAQEVKDGVVKVSVLEGVLGGVVVEKNTLYSEKLIKQGAQDVVGKPVRIASLESSLMKINDYPGMDVLGVLRPGKQVGEAELVLNAQNEDPYEYFVTADNHGTVATGQSRVFAGASANNLLGWADRLDVVALRTFSPSDSLYGSTYYEAQTPVPSLRAGGGYSVNGYDVGKAYTPLPVTGKTEQWDAYLLNSWKRSRQLSLSSRFNLASRYAQVRDDATNALINRDRLTVASAGLDADFVDARFHGVNHLGATYSKGINGVFGAMDEDGKTAGGVFSSRQGGDGKYAGGNFRKVATNYTRVQTLPFKSELQLRANTQYSKDMLVSLEQFSLGGPHSVRAYPVGEFQFDKGWFASAEWFLRAPFIAEKDAFGGRKWGDILRVSAFFDYAGGINNNPTALEVTNGTDKVELSGAGLGVELNVPKAFFVKVEAATPVSHYDASNRHNPQYWLSAGLQF